MPLICYFYMKLHSHLFSNHISRWILFLSFFLHLFYFLCRIIFTVVCLLFIFFSFLQTEKKCIWITQKTPVDFNISVPTPAMPKCFIIRSRHRVPKLPATVSARSITWEVGHVKARGHTESLYMLRISRMTCSVRSGHAFICVAELL